MVAKADGAPDHPRGHMATSRKVQLLGVAAVVAVTGAAIYVGSKGLPAPAVSAVATAQTPAAPALDPKWVVWKEADALTDKVKAGLAIKGDGGSLVLKCDEAGPGSVYVAAMFDAYLGEADYPRLIRYRFDKGNVRHGDWAQEKRHAILSDSKSVRMFASELEKSGRVAFEADDYEFNKHQFSVDVPTAKAAVDKIYADCSDPTKADYERQQRQEAASNTAWVQAEVNACKGDQACLKDAERRYLAKLGLTPR